jgi:peptidoglycan/LPS O-acetylase OafA/YrhL
LRGLAILLVVLYHAGLFGFVLPFEMQRFGWIGVDLFFVLSGYLIGGQLLKAAARGKQLSVATFYRRRALRILPAYLVVVLVYYFLPGGPARVRTDAAALEVPDLYPEPWAARRNCVLSRLVPLH